MFSFFRRKPAAAPTEPPVQTPEESAEEAVESSSADTQSVPEQAVQPETDQTTRNEGGLHTEPASRAESVQPAPAQPDAAPQAAADSHPESVSHPDSVAQPASVSHPDSVSQPESVPQPELSSEPAPVPAPAPQPEPPAKRSWLSRLKQGLARTGQNLGGIFVGVKVDEDLFEELETALIMADAGMEATEKLLTALRARVKKERLTDAQAVKVALGELLTGHLKPLEKTFPLDAAKPLVVMIAGVNGAGKTTSIGKLAHTFQEQGASVLLAAADTFRAAAREQLMEWGARNNVTVIAQEGGDPAAVAFDAVNAGRA